MRAASVSGLTLSFPWNESVATVRISIVALEKSVMQFYFSMSANYVYSASRYLKD